MVQLILIKKNQKGQALVEILLAIGLMALLLPALLTGITSTREGRVQMDKRNEALGYLREAEEAVRSIRETSWQSLATSGIFHLVEGTNNWTLASGSGSINGGEFYRQILISNVQRDTSGNIVESGGTLDPSTEEVAITVSWTDPVADFVESTSYLTRYLNNNTLIHTTKADFDAGTFNNTRTTVGNLVELSPGSSDLTYTDDYTNSSDYNFDSSKIEVSGSFAQLIGELTSSSGTLTSTFDSSSSGWTFAKYGQHDVSQTGNYVSTGGNPGGYINIDFPAAKNKIAGGYWYQGFVVESAGSVGHLSFDWKVLNYAATPDSFNIYAYIDNNNGTPTNLVWNSGAITGNTNWSSLLNLDVSSFINTAQTYYLKLAVYLDYSGTTLGPYIVGFDNVNLVWNASQVQYPTNKPTIYPKSSFVPTSVTSWESFSEVAVLNGGSIRYQLSDDNGATWQYHTGAQWATATNPTDYNDASTINQKIKQFPVTGGKLLVKAFLISDGTQLVKLDSITIGYKGTQHTAAGTFISASMDAGTSAAFNRITWVANNTATTTTEFQISTNTDNSTWNFVGPDNTSSTYFTGGQGEIPLEKIEGRYLKYKIYFTSTSNDRPSVEEVNVNYAP